jgi:hypothetical protein
MTGSFWGLAVCQVQGGTMKCCARGAKAQAFNLYFVRLLEAHLPYCLRETFAEFRRPCVSGNSLPTERCCAPAAGAVGSGRGKRVRNRSTAASSPLILTSSELNASSS